MAQTKKSVSEFIQDAFCPMIAVLCSYDAESICRKNNLTFAELIQPFCRLPSEVNYRDPSNSLISLKNLRLEIKDFNSLPPQNTLAKKLLNDSVSSPINNGISNNERSIDTEQYQLHIRTTTPWFDAWRDCFLRIVYNGDHEFLKNYLACVMVVSTSHLDPIDAFAKLVQQQNLQQQQSPAKLPKWFMANIYKYFVLLHDVTEGEESKAVSVFGDLKQQYGAGNCHLLQINSKRAGQTSGDTDETTNMPDPWRLYVKQSSSSTQQPSQSLPKKDSSISDSLSNLTELIDQELNLNTPIAHPLGSFDTSNSDLSSITTGVDEGYDGSSITSASTVIHGGCLTLSDHDRIHVFMNEFVTKGLLPWVETNLKQFNEQITSRRGITKYFSMPKKFFGSNTSTVKHAPSSSATNLPNDSIEIILRRASDLAFLFQNYEFAYTNYHAAKRDLSRDQAPTFYAGVLEMCALANFMQESSASKAYPAQYMDDAIDIYSVASRLPIFATRCVLMSTEILKSKESYDQAVQQFLKLSQEDSDLRGALFLEQAAHCFLNYRPPYIRKYAFYMIIAGHRYLKAGQRVHALRCYTDVLNIYGKPNWALALDHINFTLGKQSASLNHSTDAITSFNALFTANNRIQNAQQQINFFKEYLTIFSQLTNSLTVLPELPAPSIDNTTIKILLSSHQQATLGGHVSNCNDFDFDETREIWSDLERTITAHDRRASGTRTQINLYTNRTHNQQHPIAIANETIRVEFYVRNTLQVPLLLSEVQVLWKHSVTSWKRKASVSTADSTEDAKEYTNDTLIKQTDQPVECDVLTDCVIFPNDTSKIELSLRPCRPGYVTILGLRYRLNILVQNISDQTTWPYGIMGKTLFHVKGIRLNSNRKERLNVMYGVDKRLEIQVVPEAPLLKIEFSPMPAAMFCGEIQSCLIHLTNTSLTHSINRIRLSTSQPNLITISSTDDDSLLTFTDDSQSIWNHSLNQQSSVLTLVSHHHPLTANLTRTIRLWLHASHLAGEMNVDFLFLYESDVFQQPLRHRTVKHSSLFIITHSIGFNTQSQSTGIGELILPVQIDNLMTTPNTLSINVQQLSCISKQWNIENLSPICQNSIRYGENLSLLFKCLQKENDTDSLQLKHIHLSNDQTTKDKYVDISKTPIGDFFRHFISNIDSIPSTQRHKTPNVLPIPPISLVLLWQIAISNQLGQIEIRHGLHMISPIIQQEKLHTIQYELIYPSVIEHTFTKTLFLPVELKIFNRTNEQVNLQLQLTRSSLDNDPLLSSCCLWCGMTEQFINLLPHEHLSLTLRACFFKAGFYSLGNIALAIIDKLNSTTIPIKSNTHNYFVDIRTLS